jgi:hypothetical protein
MNCNVCRQLNVKFMKSIAIRGRHESKGVVLDEFASIDEF